MTQSVSMSSDSQQTMERYNQMKRKKKWTNAFQLTVKIEEDNEPAVFG